LIPLNIESIERMTISNYYAGVIGLSLSLSLLFLAIWRALHHFCSKRRISHSWSNRRLFHGLFCIAMTVEALAYADLSGLINLSSSPARSEKWGYILLELLGRSFLEMVAYSFVTMVWLETIKKKVGKTGGILLLCSFLLLLSTCILQALEMLRLPVSNNVDDYTISSNGVSLIDNAEEQELVWVFKLHVLAEGICWFLHGCAAVACSVWITRMIVRLSLFPHIYLYQRTRLLMKPLLPMVLCGGCYILRAIWLFVVLLQNQTRTPIQARFDLGWWVGFEWIPTLILSLMLLYSTRKRDEQSEANNDNSPLVSPVGPPVEAFVNFQRCHSLFSPDELLHDGDENGDENGDDNRSQGSYHLLSSQREENSENEGAAAQLVFL